MEDIRRNPEWVALSGRENRFCGQFGGIGDDGDGRKDTYSHTNGNGEAIVVPGVNCLLEDVAQLEERGAVFPLETAQPERATFLNGNGDVVFPAEPAVTYVIDVPQVQKL